MMLCYPFREGPPSAKWEFTGEHARLWPDFKIAINPGVSTTKRIGAMDRLGISTRLMAEFFYDEATPSTMQRVRSTIKRIKRCRHRFQ